MGCSFYGIYDRKGRTVAYGMDTDYTKAFGMIRCGKIQQCLHEDDSNKLIFLHVLDSDAFNKLRDNTITSLRACIAQQVVFPNYPEVIAKCRKRVEHYIISNVAITLARECIIEPQKEFVGLRSMESSRSATNYGIVCLISAQRSTKLIIRTTTEQRKRIAKTSPGHFNIQLYEKREAKRDWQSADGGDQ